MTVEDVIRVDADLLRVSLTADDVSRLADLLPAGDPLLDLIEVEMREQGFWRDALLAEVQDERE